MKEKDAKDQLTVDEIIEKEHLDKNEYEAEPPLFFFSGYVGLRFGCTVKKYFIINFSD